MEMNGRWYNELGSWMEVSVDNDGRIRGQYQSKVAEGPLPPIRPLLGQADANPTKGRPQALGFVVDWGHTDGSAGSVTSWCGQLCMLENGDEAIVTTWLLTVETSETWASTQVGSDTFTRQEPPPEIAAHARSLRRLRPLPTAAPKPQSPAKAE